MLWLASFVVTSTAVLGSGMPMEEATRAVGCGAAFVCAPADEVVAALADAQSVGLECASADGACWQRVLAVSSFDAIVIVERSPDGYRSLWVTAERAGSGSASNNEGAARAVSRARQASVSPPSAPEGPPRAPRAPPDPQPIRTYGWIGAAVGASAAVLCAGAATAVSASLAHDLEEAAAGRAPLEDYHLRNNAFIALGVASVVGAALASGGLWVALQSPE